MMYITPRMTKNTFALFFELLKAYKLSTLNKSVQSILVHLMLLFSIITVLQVQKIEDNRTHYSLVLWKFPRKFGEKIVMIKTLITSF